MTATVTAIKSHSTTDIVVYTAPDCPNCVRTKNYLISKGIGFLEVNITTDAAAVVSGRSQYAACPRSTRPVPAAGDRPCRLGDRRNRARSQAGHPLGPGGCCSVRPAR